MQSHVPRNSHPDINLMHPDFVHASIITCRNVNHELLDEVGSLRFARNKKVDLHTFIVVDTYSNAKVAKKDELLEMNPLMSYKGSKQTKSWTYRQLSQKESLES